LKSYSKEKEPCPVNATKCTANFQSIRPLIVAIRKK